MVSTDPCYVMDANIEVDVDATSTGEDGHYQESLLKYGQDLFHNFLIDLSALTVVNVVSFSCRGG